MKDSDLKTVLHYTISNPKIYLTGDIMYDNTLFFAELAEKKKADFLENLSLERNNYVLVTIHRDSNTDDIARLEDILVTLKDLAEEKNIIACNAITSKDDYFT